MIRDASAIQDAAIYWPRVLLLTEEDLDNAQTRDGAQFRMAEIFTQLGDSKHAFEWLERAYDSHSFWIPFLNVHPHLDSLRADRRFEDLLRRIGLQR